MKRDAALWASIFIGPLVWFLSMQANFVLAPWACALGWKPALYVVTIVGLGISAASGMLGWTEWRRLGREMPGEAGGAVARGRMMAISGVALSAMAGLVILAQGIAEAILGACQ